MVDREELLDNLNRYQPIIIIIDDSGTSVYLPPSVNSDSEYFIVDPSSYTYSDIEEIKSIVYYDAGYVESNPNSDFRIVEFNTGY